MISADFIRRSLALLPVDSRAVRDRYPDDVFVGRLMAHYDTAMIALRAAVGDPEDDDEPDDEESTPLDTPEPAEVGT